MLLLTSTNSPYPIHSRFSFEIYLYICICLPLFSDLNYIWDLHYRKVGYCLLEMLQLSPKRSVFRFYCLMAPICGAPATDSVRQHRPGLFSMAPCFVPIVINTSHCPHTHHIRPHICQLALFAQHMNVSLLPAQFLWSVFLSYPLSVECGFSSASSLSLAAVEPLILAERLLVQQLLSPAKNSHSQ